MAFADMLPSHTQLEERRRKKGGNHLRGLESSMYHIYFYQLLSFLHPSCQTVGLVGTSTPEVPHVSTFQQLDTRAILIVYRTQDSRNLTSCEYISDSSSTCV